MAVIIPLLVFSCGKNDNTKTKKMQEDRYNLRSLLFNRVDTCSDVAFGKLRNEYAEIQQESYESSNDPYERLYLDYLDADTRYYQLTGYMSVLMVKFNALKNNARSAGFSSQKFDFLIIEINARLRFCDVNGAASAIDEAEKMLNNKVI